MTADAAAQGPEPARDGPHAPAGARGERDVVVVGGGVAGLVVARDLAAAGRRVCLLEASRRLGGCVMGHEVAGLRLDAGAESFATRDPAVRDLIDELGLSGDVVEPRPGGAWVYLDGRALPLPRTGVVGIPANPWSPEVRAAIGLLGSVRASFDRVLPVWVGRGPRCPNHKEAGIGTNLARLVRLRMGHRVLDRLVAPVVGGVHSTDPAHVDTRTVAPGLLEGLERTGSLAGAVTAMRAHGAGLARPGAAVAGLDGGMNRLVAALAADALRKGVEIRFGAPVRRVERHGTVWALTVTPSGLEPATVTAHDVVFAVPGPVAANLVAPSDVFNGLAASFARGPGPVVTLATLVVDAPGLDTAPRGTGVLVAPDGGLVRAKALTHATAKWAWLAREAGPGRHVLRLSYGRGGAEPDDDVSGLDNTALRRLALADASVLLGVELTASQLVGFARTRWAGVVPIATAGHRGRAEDFRSHVESEPGRWMCGAWIAGQGLVSVVADARALAVRIGPH